MTFWCLYFKLWTYFTTSSSLPFVDFRYVFADRDTTEFIQKQYFNFIYNLWVVGVVYYCWFLISFIILYSPFRTLSFTHCTIYAENVFIIKYWKGSTFCVLYLQSTRKIVRLAPIPPLFNVDCKFGYSFLFSTACKPFFGLCTPLSQTEGKIMSTFEYVMHFRDISVKI